MFKPEADVKTAILSIPGVRAVSYDNSRLERKMVVSVNTPTGRKTGTIRCKSGKVDLAEAENLMTQMFGKWGVATLRASLALNRAYAA